MIPRLARRAIEALVFLFALLGFCFVPLGDKTALEHAKAIARTEAAAEAGRELLEATRRIRRRIFDPGEPPAPQRPTPLVAIEAEGADAGADASLPWRAANR